MMEANPSVIDLTVEDTDCMDDDEYSELTSSEDESDGAKELVKLSK